MTERPAPAPPPRPAGTSRYGWMVGILAVIILAYIALNTLRHQGLGAGGLRPGTRLPPFAAPLLNSTLQGDVNVAARPDARGVRACSVRGPRVLNSCDLVEGAPLVLGFLFTRGAHCEPSFDAMQRLSTSTPGVRFAGVVVRGDRGQAQRIARRHRWTFPIAYDHDGVLANLYGVAGCPDVMLAYPDGVLRGTLLGGDRAERGLADHVAGLVAASRARGWRPAP